MATPKYKNIKFGPGAFNEKNAESEWFIEQRAPYSGVPGTVAWDIITTYSSGDAILYQGISYNSLQAANTGNQPDISPLWWSPVDGKDGDVWMEIPAAAYPIGGGDVELYLKANNTWQGVKGTPVTVALVDGQLTPAVAFEFPASTFRYAKVEYTIKRGSGHGRKRKGMFEILNDGTSPNPVYSHEYNEIGNDVNVPFIIDYSGGKVRVLYTSVLEGVVIECKYVVKGWA